MLNIFPQDLLHSSVLFVIIHCNCQLNWSVRAMNGYRGFSKWNPVSLSACQKYLKVEVILISEFMTSEMRITSTNIVWSDSYFWIHRLRNRSFDRQTGKQDFISKKLQCIDLLLVIIGKNHRLFAFKFWWHFTEIYYRISGLTYVFQQWCFQLQ